VIVGPALGGLLFAITRARLRGRRVLLARRARGDRSLPRPRRRGAGVPDLASVLGGVRLVRRTPVLLGAISLDLFAVLFGGAVALLPVFAKDVLEVGPAGSACSARRPRSARSCAAIVMSRGPCAGAAGRC
jgi:hypothetical protein